MRRRTTLTLSRRIGGLWPHARPQWGNLAIPQLAALCDVLAATTTTPDGCFFGLWEGWAQLHGSPAVAHLGSDEPVPPALTDTEHASPRLRSSPRTPSPPTPIG